MDLTDKRTIKKLLVKNRLWAKKSLGQNFLVDKEVLAKIIQTAGLTKKDIVLEIGAGLGILTQELCKKAKRVISIEKDEKLVAILKETCGNFKNLEIINSDVLSIENEKWSIKNYKIVANLPYNIAAPVLRKFLTAVNKPFLMVVMLQQEVAEKIISKPPKTNILALSVQAYGSPTISAYVKKESFWPKPKVDSTILKIKDIYRRIKIEEKKFFQILHIGFASPRKKLLNNLSAGYQLEKEKVKKIFRLVHLSENIRAQELSLSQWEELASNLNKVL